MDALDLPPCAHLAVRPEEKPKDKEADVYRIAEREREQTGRLLTAPLVQICTTVDVVPAAARCACGSGCAGLRPLHA